MRKQPDVPETEDVEAHLQQGRRPGGAPEDQPLARDADAPQDVPDVRMPKFAFGPRRMTSGDWNQ